MAPVASSSSSSSSSQSSLTRSAALTTFTLALFATATLAHPSAGGINQHHRDVGSVVPRQASSGGAVVPIAPGPGYTFRQGQTCTTEWTPTTNSSWNSFTIELMTGSNYQMKSLAVVKTGIDGTDTSNTILSWPCPTVDPYGAIYFYQYTLADGSEPTWTTRFTIADANGQVESPAHTTVITGTTVAWGNGKLVSAQTQSAQVGSSTASSGSGSGSGSSAAATTTQAPTSSASAAQAQETDSSSSLSSSEDDSSSSSTSSSGSSSATAQSKNTNSTSGAAAVVGAGVQSTAALMIGGVVAGVAAFFL